MRTHRNRKISVTILLIVTLCATSFSVSFGAPTAESKMKEAKAAAKKEEPAKKSEATKKAAPAKAAKAEVKANASMKKDELLAIAKDMGIEVTAKATKADILAAIEAK